MLNARRAVEVVQEAYRLAAIPGSPWLQQTFSVLRGELDVGLGALAYAFDRDSDVWIGAGPNLVGDAHVATAVRASFHLSPEALRRTVYGAGPVVRLNQLFGVGIRDTPMMGSMARALGCWDFLGVRACDVDGRGHTFCAPLPKHFSFEARLARRWSQLAAHLTAAARLHRALSTGAPVPTVRLRGREVEAAPDARADLPALLAAVRRRESARGADERLSMWNAVAAGRWSLVDHLDTDGSRWVVAYMNQPNALDPRALSGRERAVAQLAALGHGDKQIAYALGLTDGAVGAQLTAVRRKLSVRSRAELVRVVSLLRADNAIEVEVAGERLAVAAERPAETAVLALSEAEREVAVLAARGLSNAEIAVQRGTTVRTVANQMASIFARLGIGSRAALAGRLFAGGGPPNGAV